MKLTFKNVLRINNKLENTGYYRGFPNKDFINSNNLALMLEVIISDLILTKSFLYLLNSYDHNDKIFINICLVNGILGKEEYRIKFSLNIIL
jgi:hypothetical protein